MAWRYGIYITDGQRPEDSVNAIPTQRRVMEQTCTMALGYRKHTKTNFGWTVYLFTS